MKKCLKALLFFVPLSAQANELKSFLNYEVGFKCTVTDRNEGVSLGYNFGSFQDGISKVVVNPRVISFIEVSYDPFEMGCALTDTEFSCLGNEGETTLTIDTMAFERKEMLKGVFGYKATGTMVTPIFGGPTELPLECSFKSK